MAVPPGAVQRTVSPAWGSGNLALSGQDSRPSAAGGRAASLEGCCCETRLEGAADAEGGEVGSPKGSRGLEWKVVFLQASPESRLHKLLGLVFAQP